MGRSVSSGGERKELLAPDQLLDFYQQLRDRSRRMLDWAQAGDWDELLAEESRYVDDVQRLSGFEPREALAPEQMERRLSLMEQILEYNLDVKRHLESRKDELGELISLSRRQGELGRSYGTIDALDKP